MVCIWYMCPSHIRPSHSHLLALVLVLDEGGDLGQQRIELRIHLLFHLEHLLLLLGLNPGNGS